MASPYLGISYLKQISFSEKYLRAVFSYIPTEDLKEYLYNANIGEDHCRGDFRIFR